MRSPHLLFSLLLSLSLTPACDDDASGTTTQDTLGDLGESCGNTTCSTEQACCDGACVTLVSSREHCGTCGNACDSGFVCDQGACTLSCQAGLDACGGVCRDLQSDTQHCGTCDAACGPGQACNGGVCECEAGFDDCNGDASDGCETSLLSSIDHCGACDSACPTDNATPTCNAGTCELTCEPTAGNCDDLITNGCETDLSSSDDHCGVCDNPCGASASCQFGICSAGQQIGTGEAHSCAVMTTGQVQCWGLNDQGQLGDSTLTDASSPVTVSNLADATQIAVAGKHSCALTSSGAVFCWGDNSAGQLGDNSQLQRSTPTPVSGSLETVVQISAGREHTCALEEDGDIWCWGENDDGRLGDDTKTPSTTPVQVANITGARHISAGGSNTCAVVADSIVQCWGGNFFGQLADGTTTDRDVPVAIPDLSAIVEVHAGGGFMCATLPISGARCWGLNPRGQLGNGSSSDATTPDDVQNLDVRVLTLDAGGAHTCAVIEGNTARCWGSNTWGELGDDGATTLESNVPVDVATLTDVIEVSTGDDHSCAMTGDRSVFCWGRGDSGQLGTGLLSDADAPVAVSF